MEELERELLFDGLDDALSMEDSDDEEDLLELDEDDTELLLLDALLEELPVVPIHVESSTPSRS